MRFRIAIIIFRKELVDMLRDKRTLAAMIGLPLLLYPALFIFGSQAALMQQGRILDAQSPIAIVAHDAELLEEWLSRDSRLVVRESSDPTADLALRRLHAIIRADDNFEKQVRGGGTGKVRVEYDASESASQEAARRVVETLEKRFDSLLVERLQRMGLSQEFANPLEVGKVNIAPSTKTTGALLGMLTPLVMILMLGVGAFYPAIDLTAGEKERGTFETLLSTPARSMEILVGKFLAVFSLAIITGLVNLGSMTATLAFQLTQLEDEIGEFSLRIPPENVLLLLVALVPLAFFVSAVMMTIAVMARSFREAQSLLTPFLILLLFPAALAAVPGTRLTTATQFAPVANIALLFKDLMTDQANLQAAAMVLLSTSIYALLALALASRVFRREDVVLSVEVGIPLTWRRSDLAPRELPTPGIALFTFAACLLLLFYLGTYLQGTYALLGVGLTQWLLFLLPTLLILWFVRVDLKAALGLRMPSATAWAGTIVIALGWVVISLQLSVWQQRILPMPPELADEMKRLLRLEESSVLLLLLVLAFSPAICEEALFRGALLSGLRKHLPPWALLPCVGAAFGVMHLSVHRMAITGVSGVVLTYLAWRCRSIFPAVLAHFIINASAVLIQTGYVPPAIKSMTAKAIDQELGFPVWILLAAAVGFAAGVVLLERLRTRAQ